MEKEDEGENIVEADKMLLSAGRGRRQKTLLGRVMAGEKKNRQRLIIENSV